jgi:formylglycine-generating enzyme required for sulfatase activity
MHLTKAIAEEFIQGLTAPNLLESCQSIDDEAAEYLAFELDGEILELNGLQSISEITAKHLGETHTYRLELNGLKSMTARVAKLLAKHQGDIGLDGLEELPDDVALALSRHDHDFGLLYFGGVKRFSSSKGHLAIARYLAAGFAGEQLSLHGLEDMHPKVARLFAKSDVADIEMKAMTPSEELKDIFEGSDVSINWTAAEDVDINDEDDDEPPPSPIGTFPDPPGTITNSIGMKLVPIPAGTFLMGSPEDCPLANHDEELQHPVRITKSFLLGMHQVTQGQFYQVTGENPSFFRGPELPVEHLTWKEAHRFCEVLSALPEEQAAGRRYRLPTEAEWEYVCRAGTTTPYNTGETLKEDQARFALTNRSVPKQTAPVGSYPPNAWGLYDMHGNVWEWTNDWFSADYFHESPVDDPQGPATGTHHTLRGGSASMEGHECRTAFRGEAAALDGPDTATLSRIAFYGDLGVRVACEVGPETTERERHGSKPTELEPTTVTATDNITEEIASQRLKHAGPVVALSEFRSLDDQAAKVLANYEGTLYLDGLVVLSAKQAEALAKYKGDTLILDGLTALSDEAAAALSKYKGELRLRGLRTLSSLPLARKIAKQEVAGIDGLTALSDESAAALAKYKDELRLDGLTSLTAEAAEALSKHKYELHLKGLASLTPEAAEALSKHKGELFLDGISTLSDTAAAALANHKGRVSLNGLTTLASEPLVLKLAMQKGDLYLNGLTALSDAAAEALSKHKGPLSLSGLTSLSPKMAESLAKHGGDLRLDGLATLTIESAEAIAKLKGRLDLNGLPDLPAEVAEALAKNRGSLFLGGLTTLLPQVAQALAKHDGDFLALNGLNTLPAEVAEALAKHKGELSLSGLRKLTDKAAVALKRHKGRLYLYLPSGPESE